MAEDNRQEIFMTRAIRHGYMGRGHTTPNPAVGAVIVGENDKVLGEGYHAKAGEDHAEIVAIKAAGGATRNAEMFVTLEPCNGYGKTPPCTKAIIEAGIKKVYIGTLDPNQDTVGAGVQTLRDRGIEVEVGIKSHESRMLCEDFAKYITTGTPLVTVKYAMTIDGKIATLSGDAYWISSPESRELSHSFRWNHNIIAVGNNTVWVDDPKLTVRLDGYTVEEGPTRLVISSIANIPMDASVITSLPKPGTIVACTERAPEMYLERLIDAGVELIITKDEQGRVDLKEVVDELGRRGVHSILFEGGQELLGSIIDTGYADKIYAFIAPKVVGGGAAKGPVGGRGQLDMSEALELNNTQLRVVGPDILFSGYLADINQYFPTMK